MHIVQACNPSGSISVDRISKGLQRLGHTVTKLAINKQIAHDDEGMASADIIHFHEWYPEIYPAYRKPWIVTVDNHYIDTTINESYLSNIVAVSEFAAQHIGTIHYVWKCAEDTPCMAIQDDYFLWIGNIDKADDDGLFAAIDMAKKVKFNFVIAGTGNNKDTIEHIAASCDSHIRYLGKISNGTKIRLLQRAKALLYPSRWPDAFPDIVAESLMCGTPIIASKEGSLPEIVVNNFAGYLCNSLHQYIDAVRNIHKISRANCRAYAIKNFSMERCAKQYVNIYAHTIETYARQHKESHYTNEETQTSSVIGITDSCTSSSYGHTTT